VRADLVNGVAPTSRRRGFAKDNFAAMWSISGNRTSPAKETAMPTRRFERITLAQLLLSGCAVVFGACVLIEQARAQYVPPPTPLPPPVFNPSSPYTVPQPSYRPIAPAIPSAVPGYVVTSPPVSERPPRTAARSHRRTSVAKTRSAHHRARSVIVRPGPESYSSYYSPFGYGYGCAWWRGWDGYWFRTSPCS
jgi:hypothetical protein